MQEGEFASITVRRLRKRQMRNFFVCLMVSQVLVFPITSNLCWVKKKKKRLIILVISLLSLYHIDRAFPWSTWAMSMVTQKVATTILTAMIIMWGCDLILIQFALLVVWSLLIPFLVFIHCSSTISDGIGRKNHHQTSIGSAVWWPNSAGKHGCVTKSFSLPLAVYQRQHQAETLSFSLFLLAVFWTTGNANLLASTTSQQLNDSSGMDTSRGCRTGPKPVGSWHSPWYLIYRWCLVFFYLGISKVYKRKDWYLVNLGQTDHSLKGEIYVAFNASHLPVAITLPNRPGYRWEPLVDTGKPTPYDFLSDDLPDRDTAAEQFAHFLDSDLYPMLGYSSIIVILHPSEAWFDNLPL